MERVHKLHEVRQSLSQITHTQFHHRHSRRCFIVSFVCLFFLLMLYIPTFHQLHTQEHHIRTHGDQVDVVGWSRHTSRDLKKYILPENSTAIIPQPNICSEKLFLLIVVCSAAGNFEARSAIRQTWASTPIISYKDRAVRVAFLLGDSGNNTVQKQIEEESVKHRDIIQEGFLDTYKNLTLKSVMLLKWVVTNCPSVRYIMKTDDDTFVNIESLVRLLHSRSPTDLLMGDLFCGTHPFSNARSKWYAPRYMYPGRVYPNYLSGSGYVMTKDVVKRLYKTALQTPLFHMEDVYVTGLCSKSAGISPCDDPAFSRARRRLDACLLRDRSVVTSHYMDSAQLRKIWPRIRNPNLDCSNFTASQKPSSRPNKKTAKVRCPVNNCV